MLVEQKLCRKLVDIFRSALPPNVEVEGNWLPSDDGGFKGEADVSGSVLHIRVSQRSYGSFTDKIADFRVELEGSIRVEEDTDMSGTFICCGKILSVLAGWQDDIAAVKRDLSVESHFDPVGYRMDPNGDLDIENVTLTRKYNQSFTLKGRIHK